MCDLFELMYNSVMQTWGQFAVSEEIIIQINIDWKLVVTAVSCSQP